MLDLSRKHLKLENYFLKINSYSYDPISLTGF